LGVTGIFLEEEAQPTKKSAQAMEVTLSFNEGRWFKSIDGSDREVEEDF
jgi:hypothetical protein